MDVAGGSSRREDGGWWGPCHLTYPSDKVGQNGQRDMTILGGEHYLQLALSVSILKSVSNHYSEQGLGVNSR